MFVQFLSNGSNGFVVSGTIAVVFYCLFNTWLNLTYYFSRYPNSDLVHSVHMLVQGACVLGMTMHAEKTVSTYWGRNIFAVAFVAARLHLLVMYIPVYIHIPKSHYSVRVWIGPSLLASSVLVLCSIDTPLSVCLCTSSIFYGKASHHFFQTGVTSALASSLYCRGVSGALVFTNM